MEDLDEILALATQGVAKPYFLLPIFGGDPVSRERVYCYELYHQMRCLWPDRCRYILNGEVDKRAHRKLQELGVGNEKPDFLIHNPGTLEDNHAIIEVKAYKAMADKIRKDLQTFKVFLGGPKYHRAIYLFYGDGEPEPLMKRVVKAAAIVQGVDGVEIWHHSAAGKPAEKLAVF